MLSRQCGVRKSSRTIALRELLEGALFQYGHMFGANDSGDDSSYKPNKNFGNNNNNNGGDLLLFKLNQRQHIANVWESNGKLTENDKANGNQDLENLFLGAITACCKSEVSRFLFLKALRCSI